MTKKTALIGSAAVVLAAIALAPTTVRNSSAESIARHRVERGRYLVSTSACHDCHTPWIMGAEGPEPDMSRALSGHPQDIVLTPAPELGDGPWGMVASATNTAFAGPWGVSFTANLTPDENTGIGVWTEDIFVNTIRSGRHWGAARPILPPMPWQVYRQMTDDDLKSIYAYLRTIQPHQNRVPEPVPPTPGAGVAAG